MGNSYSYNLIINNKNINSISGPVSLYILQPRDSFFIKMRKQGIYAPIFMLFGDMHFSDKNLCVNCSCMYDKNTKKCCIPIYSDEFFTLLNNITSKKFPIDFYFEGADIKFLKGKISEDDKNSLENDLENDKTPLGIFRNKMIFCKDIDNKEKKQCKTISNLRIHYGDSRNNNSFKKTFERFSARTFKDDIEGILRQRKYSETINYNFYTRSLINRNYGKNPCKGIISDKDKILYLNALRYIYTKNFFEHINIPEIKKNSLIFKQLHKMEPKLQEYWLNMISKYFYNVYLNCKTRYGIEKEFNEFINKIIDFMIFCLKSYKEKDEKTDYEAFDLQQEYFVKNLQKYLKNLSSDLTTKIINLLTSLFAPFLDLYTLLRSFKKPQNNINSILNICYFGSEHVENISYFLKDIMQEYELVYYKNNRNYFTKNNTNKVNRCLTFDKDINIDEILNQYKQIS